MEEYKDCPQCGKEAVVGFMCCVHCGRELSRVQVQDGQLLLTDVAGHPEQAFAVRKGDSEVVVSSMGAAGQDARGYVEVDLRMKNGIIDRVSLPMRKFVDAVVRRTEIIDV